MVEYRRGRENKVADALSLDKWKKGYYWQFQHLFQLGGRISEDRVRTKFVIAEVGRSI